MDGYESRMINCSQSGDAWRAPYQLHSARIARDTTEESDPMAIDIINRKVVPSGQPKSAGPSGQWHRGEGCSFRVDPDGSIEVRLTVQKVLGDDGKPHQQTFAANITREQYQQAKPKTEATLKATGTRLLPYVKAVVQTWGDMPKADRQAAYDRARDAIVKVADAEGFADGIRFQTGKRAGQLAGSGLDTYMTAIMGHERTLLTVAGAFGRREAVEKLLAEASEDEAEANSEAEASEDDAEDDSEDSEADGE